jgi:splicing factor 3B subunit 4
MVVEACEAGSEVDRSLGKISWIRTHGPHFTTSTTAAPPPNHNHLSHFSPNPLSLQDRLLAVNFQRGLLHKVSQAFCFNFQHGDRKALVYPQVPLTHVQFSGANLTRREQDKEATVYIGNLDERVTDSLVWELMLQAGRIVNVHLPKDRVSQAHQGYGFVEFVNEEDADYAAKIMNQVRLYGKPIRVNKASADKQKTVDVGAELFIGNLDSLVDEKLLYDTFSRFGNLIQTPKVMRDENNMSKGFGFVSFADFEASDAAIAAMHGQYLMNREVTVQYAYKKDGKGERHGDEAERKLASQARQHNVQLPVQPVTSQVFQTPAAIPPATPVTPVAPAGFGRPPPQLNPLPPAPSGLPARPPPSMAGYGGPPGLGPGGFNGGPPGGPPQQYPGPPAGFGGPPGGPPPGFPQRR